MVLFTIVPRVIFKKVLINCSIGITTGGGGFVLQPCCAVTDIITYIYTGGGYKRNHAKVYVLVLLLYTRNYHAHGSSSIYRVVHFNISNLLFLLARVGRASRGVPALRLFWVFLFDGFYEFLHVLCSLYQVYSFAFFFGSVYENSAQKKIMKTGDTDVRFAVQARGACLWAPALLVCVSSCQLPSRLLYVPGATATRAQRVCTTIYHVCAVCCCSWLVLAVASTV